MQCMPSSAFYVHTLVPRPRYLQGLCPLMLALSGNGHGRLLAGQVACRVRCNERRGDEGLADVEVCLEDERDVRLQGRGDRRVGKRTRQRLHGDRRVAMVQYILQTQ